MAIMNQDQRALLTALDEARATYEQFEEELAQEVADRKWEAKENIRHLVREARKNNVPYRRIGFALETSDHRTVKDLEHDRRR